jgi:hypothetical protein
MNIRLDIALNDITGVSGMAILQAIVAGQRGGKALAKYILRKPALCHCSISLNICSRTPG